jgi:DNA-directed RNA polymerase subunit beta
LGFFDDIDHLANKRVRAVGELLQNQTRLVLLRLERLIKERMTFADPSFLSPAILINPKPLTASFKEFFGSNPLSQFMDQINPLAEITHKRRISNLGPGGLSKDRISLAVRDIHPSHYGRICPIETPEGPNAGLIGSFASYARVNPYGFIESPFYQVQNGQVLKDLPIHYLTADQEDIYYIAMGDIPLTAEGFFKNQMVPVRHNQDFKTVLSTEIDFFAVSPIQTFSIAAGLIPFLEHDDGNRALMGSNMQRQAVPLLSSTRPIVGTGLETQIVRDSGLIHLSPVNGTVIASSGSKVSILSETGKEFHYELEKYQRSNQDTCINQRPAVFLWPISFKGSSNC